MRRFGLIGSIGCLLLLTGALGWSRSVRVTSEELHRGGGVPPGWTFAVPPGDATKGKELFAALECYSCHEVTGAGFPPKATEKSGPNLTRMGAHHPAEYFAESILDPNAVIIDAPGFYGEDGRSTMPSYAESLTLEQWVNLVAYLKSLTGEIGPGALGSAASSSAGHHTGHHGPAPERNPEAPSSSPDPATGHHASSATGLPPSSQPDHHASHREPRATGHDGHHAAREKTVGAYTVRLDYRKPSSPRRTGFLTAFVSDAETGRPVPYLPLRARVGKASRPITLGPVLGPAGPHYGAAVTIPDTSKRVTISVGRPTVRVEPGTTYGSPAEVWFEW